MEAIVLVSEKVVCFWRLCSPAEHNAHLFSEVLSYVFASVLRALNKFSELKKLQKKHQTK